MKMIKNKIKTQLMMERLAVQARLQKQDLEKAGGIDDVELVLARQMQQKLERVDEALGRIETGIYGACMKCCQPIDAERLESNPEAELCINCQRQLEHKYIRQYAYAYAQ
jgi:RNA polymerase-binding transcription factor DksA